MQFAVVQMWKSQIVCPVHEFIVQIDCLFREMGVKLPSREFGNSTSGINHICLYIYII